MKLIYFLAIVISGIFAESVRAKDATIEKLDLPMMVFLSTTTCKDSSITTKEVAELAKLMNIESAFLSGKVPPHYEALVKSASEKSLELIKAGGEKKYCEYISDIHKIVAHDNLLENLITNTFNQCSWMTAQKLRKIRPSSIDYGNISESEVSEVAKTLKIQMLMKEKYGKTTYCYFMRVTYDAIYD